MKNQYLHALSAGMILERDYDPVRTETGDYVFGDALKVLSRHSQGANFIIELLDADNLSGEEIQHRLKADQEILASDISGEITHLIGVYVFNGSPDSDKIAAIVDDETLRKQGGAQSGAPSLRPRKYRSYFVVNLNNRTVTRYFQSIAPTDGLEKMLHRAFLAPENGPGAPMESPPDIHQLLIQRNQEYRVKLKTRKTTVTYALIAINVAVWLILKIIAEYYYHVPYENLLILGGKVNQYIVEGQYWRLITPIFFHGNEIHLLVNCYSLYVLGQLMERIYGPHKFAIIYFAAGILGNIMSMMFTLPYSLGVGASGAIFGLFGAILYFGIENPKVFKKYFGANVIVTVIINAIIAALIPNIDSFAHLGGMIGGVLVSGIVKVNAPANQFPNRYMMLTITLFLAIAGLFFGIHRIVTGV